MKNILVGPISEGDEWTELLFEGSLGISDDLLFKFVVVVGDEFHNGSFCTQSRKSQRRPRLRIEPSSAKRILSWM